MIGKIRKLWKKTSYPTLDSKTADEILQYVFETCGREPNTIPMEVLTSYQNYRKERYSLQKQILSVVLLLFFLLPRLFILPDFSLNLSADANPGRPVYRIEVKNFLPVSQVTAAVDGSNLSVYETGNRSYSVEPTRNGTMTVTVTMANRQYMEKRIPVRNVDREAPKLLSNRQEKGHIYLYFEDELSGVDFENVYALDEDGKRIAPLSCDADTGCIEFASPETMINVFIPDLAGNRLQLIVSVS